MASIRIVVAGDINGNFKDLFNKVAEINITKGPFEALYCVGNFFGPNFDEYEELKSGKIEVPLNTYLVNGNQTYFKEMCDDLQKAVPKIAFLGKMGRVVCHNGLKIAYLSGVELPENLRNDETAVTRTFRKDNIYISRLLVDSMIRSIGSGIDVLLTAPWPKDVTNYAVSLDDDDEAKVKDCSSHLVAYLAKCLKPRYHFSALSGLYYERVPYRNSEVAEKSSPITRFIGLAPVKAGKTKHREKWMYGLNIKPQGKLSSQELFRFADSSTVCPYGATIDNEDSKKNFFFDDSAGPSCSKKRSAENDHENSPKKPAIDASSCWFCLSNKNVEKDLIITVGDYCYIALAKGVLTPEHVFIVPIEHVPSSIELATDAFEEMEKFKTALAAYFHDQDKDVTFFERNYRSPHLQVQAVPVPKGLGDEIENKLYAHASHYDVTHLPQLANIKAVKELPLLREGIYGQKRHYFYFEVTLNKKPEGKYLAMIESSVNDFPLQIGRHILADVLHVKDRVNWQDCTDSVEEKKMAEKMRESFKSYDFTKQ